VVVILPFDVSRKDKFSLSIGGTFLWELIVKNGTRVVHASIGPYGSFQAVLRSLGKLQKHLLVLQLDRAHAGVQICSILRDIGGFAPADGEDNSTKNHRNYFL
jgi:hypothetical protein